METHHVFIIWHHRLFYEALQRLLKSAGIECLGASRDSAEAFSQIVQLRPDTVLVEDEETGAAFPGVMDLLEANPPQMRVFRFSLTDNLLRIYHQEQRVVLQAEDLASLIQSVE